MHRIFAECASFILKILKVLLKLIIPDYKCIFIYLFSVNDVAIKLVKAYAKPQVQEDNEIFLLGTKNTALATQGI